MYQSMARALMKRGAVFKVFRVEFEDNPHPKYCILMEDYCDGVKDIIVVFTTHRTEFDWRLSSVKIKDGGIKGIIGDTLIQCDNYWSFEPDVFYDSQKSEYLTDLSKDQMKQVDEALAYINDIDEATLIRMLG